MERYISFAIQNKRLLQLAYMDLLRIVEPYVYGMHNNGQQVLYCYQVDGESLVDEEGWRQFYLYKIHDLQILDKRFNELRNEYPVYKIDFDKIFCEVRI